MSADLYRDMLDAFARVIAAEEDRWFAQRVHLTCVSATGQPSRRSFASMRAGKNAYRKAVQRGAMFVEVRDASGEVRRSHGDAAVGGLIVAAMGV